MIQNKYDPEYGVYISDRVPVESLETKVGLEIPDQQENLDETVFQERGVMTVTL